MLYVETLADLTKNIESKSPENIVRIIANKVPEIGASPNTHHRELSIGNLLGYGVSFSRFPFLMGGKYYMLNNKTGIVFDEQPELQAFQRWRNQDFLAIEKGIASLWRQYLAEFDYDYFLNLIKEILGSDFKKPKSIEESYDIATKIVKGQGHRYKTFLLLKNLININEETFKKIIGIWNKKNMIPINDYAPYAAHVLKVDIFFILCTSSSLISRDRKSNRADIAYLYYLPFTNIFTSNDKLHKRIVPLFIDVDQRFVPGEDLKKDLSNLDQYFARIIPEEEKQNGVYSFAWYPPDNDNFLTTTLWDSLRPNWRLRDTSLDKKESSEEKKMPEGLKEHIKKAFREIKEREGQDVPLGFDIQSANDVILKRVVRGRKGKWQLFSNEIIQSKERLTEDDN